MGYSQGASLELDNARERQRKTARLPRPFGLAAALTLSTAFRGKARDDPATLRAVRLKGISRGNTIRFAKRRALPQGAAYNERHVLQGSLRAAQALRDAPFRRYRAKSATCRRAG